MLYKPRKFKFKKIHKGKIKNLKQFPVNKINDISFGTYALKSLEKGELKPNQIEAVRKLLSREIKKYGKIWIKVFSNIVRTSKPAEVRMGKGKGSPDFWVCTIKSGQVLFEISNIKYSVAKALLLKASNKLPVLTQFIKKT